ncbi:MAG: rod shape-determining protein RodA [Gaiellaceae bacterium MAG52_C11]|nr:rod shape-determining protein RodA [Candidatus Gaiellasilicea maunaloa]
MLDVSTRSTPRQGVDVLAYARRLDWLLVAAVGALVAYGLWAVAGITRYDVEDDERYYVIRQAIAVGLGSVALLVALAVDPDRYRRAQRVIFGSTIVLMVLVFLLAQETRGSKRWIDIGPFQFQPSEFGKLLFVLALAGFLADRARRLDAGVVLQAVGLALIPILLVFKQPDLGTSLVYSAALAACLFAAGARWTHLLALAAAAVAVILSVVWLLPSAGVEVLEPYQKERLTGFANPDRDPGGTTYNVTQSITAVGSGGLDGRGVAGATQTRLDYLPEHATDFVFASFAEQRGFFGAALLLGLYLLVVWRGLRIITVARDAYGAIVAGGIVLAFLFQIFVNVGMTMGIAPVTGIPLPFVTVGGSSMVANLAAIGVLLSIHARGNLGRRRS